MPSKRLEKPPSDAPEGAPASKSSKLAWKNGGQYEVLLSFWTGFLEHQDSKTLARFWPHVYDAWYKMWPITPTPESIDLWGSSEAAMPKLRSRTNLVRILPLYH